MTRLFDRLSEILDMVIRSALEIGGQVCGDQDSHGNWLSLIELWFSRVLFITDHSKILGPTEMTVKTVSQQALARNPGGLWVGV